MPQRQETEKPSLPLHLRKPRPLWTSSEPGHRVEYYDFYGVIRERNGARELPAPAKVLPFCRGL